MYIISQKELTFMTRLEQEKEQFIKSMETIKEILEKIKKFKDLATVKEFAQDMFTLRGHFENAFAKVEEFNLREETFSQPKSEYPDLKALHDEFKPFDKLIEMAKDVEDWITDATTMSFMKNNPSKLDSDMKGAHQLCFTLNKTLMEDYPDTAQVTQDLKADIEKFRQYMPLIKSLRSDAIKEDDWQEILAAVGDSAKGLELTEDLTL